MVQILKPDQIAIAIVESWPWLPDWLAISCWGASMMGDADALGVLAPPGAASMPGGSYMPDQLPRSPTPPHLIERGEQQDCVPAASKQQSASATCCRRAYLGAVPHCSCNARLCRRWLSSRREMCCSRLWHDLLHAPAGAESEQEPDRALLRA